MLIHIVCWKYKGDINDAEREDHREKLRALESVIPEVRRMAVGEDILHLDRSFDTGLVVDFEDAEALQRYTDHPQHLEVALLGKTIAEKVVSVDFLA
jgi:hypothetical protein